MTKKAQVHGDKRKTISFTTFQEVEVEVEVDVPLKDVMNDIIASLTEDDLQDILGRDYNKPPMDLDGDELKRHLCDLAGVSYGMHIEVIFRALKDKL